MWKAKLKVKPTFTKPRTKIRPQEEPEDTKCKEFLKKVYDFWDEYRDNVVNAEDKHPAGIKRRWGIDPVFGIYEKLDEIPEEICCEFIEFVKRWLEPQSKTKVGWDEYKPYSFAITPSEYGIGLTIRKMSVTLYRIRIAIYGNDVESKKHAKLMIEDIKKHLIKQFRGDTNAL